MSDERLRDEIEEYVNGVWPDVVADIASLVEVNSVEDLEHAAPGAPFGPAPKEALTRALRIARRLGMDVTDEDGYIGYADIPGDEGQIATIGHADIVPTGTGWDGDPLTLERRDGFLIGRGILDDKGPLVLSLYAANFVRLLAERRGTTLPRAIRCIVGCNEETGMADVEYYRARHDDPDFLFTPDAEFPLIYGEKGHMAGVFTSAASEGRTIVEFRGGTVVNAIPGLATALVRADVAGLPVADGIDVAAEGDGLVRLTAHGKGGHASMPAGTVNAIGMLVDYLRANVELCDADREWLELEAKVMGSTDGSSLGIACSDEAFGHLTCIGGVIDTQDGTFTQTIDSRYPTSITNDLITGRMTELAAAHGATYACLDNAAPFLGDPDSREIGVLVDTYNEYAGDDGVAFTIGGGTYARKFSRGAAFGPVRPGITYPEWVGPEHGPNEGFAEEDLRLALKIYAASLTRLVGLAD